MEKLSSNAKSVVFKIDTVLKAYEYYILSTLRKLSELQYFFYSLIFYYIGVSHIKTDVILKISSVFIGVSFLAAVFKYCKFVMLEKVFRRLTNLLLVLCSVIILLYTFFSMSYCCKNWMDIFIITRNFVMDNESLFYKTLSFIKIIMVPVSGIMCIVAKIKDYVRRPDYDQIPTVNFLDGSRLKINIIDEGLKIPFFTMICIITSWLTTKNTVSSTIMIIDMIVCFIRFAGHKKYTFMLPMIFSNLVSLLMILTNYFDVLKMKWLNLHSNIVNN